MAGISDAGLGRWCEHHAGIAFQFVPHRDSVMHDSALETVAFTLRLRGSPDEYRRRHDEIWPEMEAALRAAGVVEYEIYLAPDGETLFAWMRRLRDHGLVDMRNLDVWRRWQLHMADLLVTDGIGPVRTDLARMFLLRQQLD